MSGLVRQQPVRETGRPPAANGFGVIFFSGHYHLGQAAATATAAVLGLGALLGILIAARLADLLLSRGRLRARVTIGGVSYLAAAVLFAPPIIIGELAIALPLFVLATAALTAPSAPLDAAVLDVIPAALWGRAEGVLTALRTLAMAAAPVLFGFLADELGRTGTHSFGQGTFGSGRQSGAQGLEVTFLIMLIALAIAGLVLLRARSSHPRDVATAIDSDRATDQGSDRERTTGQSAAARTRRTNQRTVTGETQATMSAERRPGS